MSTALTLIIILLVLLLMLLAVALLMYYTTQQDLRNISTKLSVLDVPKPAAARSPDAVRRERSAAFDRLVMLEASFNTQPRDQLSPEEMDAFEEARRVIKSCNAELQRLGDWMGLPYDLEWSDVKERLPRITPLYRQAVEASLKEEAPSGP